MPTIIPFRGYRYNQSKVAISDVVAPPYDVISPEQQATLYDASPFNVVRLILGREEDRYVSAARNFEEWQRTDVLVRDESPGLYLLHQEFEDREGRTVTRKGFIALCRLEEFEKRIVLPHERTHAKPREDRFQLFKATNANFSQVFSLYADPEKEIDRLLNGIAQASPTVDVLFEDVQHRLWRIDDQQAIRGVQEFLHGKQALIADGHHRYETALAYRDLMRFKNPTHSGQELYNYIMMFFSNIDDDGLVIYPTHRVVHSLPQWDGRSFLKKLEEYFIVRDIRDVGLLHEGMKSSSVCAFGLAMSDAPVLNLLTLKPLPSPQELIEESLPPEVKALDVTILHHLILKTLLGISVEAQEHKANLEYVKDVRQALDAVEKGKAQLAFLVNPTTIEQVRAVAKAGHTMPQKSTYFYPKLLSGLVINKLAE